MNDENAKTHIRTRIIVTATAEVDIEVTPHPDGSGSFVQCAVPTERLMISVAADYRKDETDHIAPDAKDYLAYSAAHTMTEVVLHRIGKKLKKDGEEPMPAQSLSNVVGIA